MLLSDFMLQLNVHLPLEGLFFLKSLCLLEQDGEQSSQLSEHEYQPSVELNEADQID